MAEAKKLPLADILARRKEFEDMVAAQMESERPAALIAVQEQITLFSFTADELGFKGGSASTKTPATSKNAAGGTCIMSKPLKSTKGDETGVWLNYPPKFLGAEGCFETFKSGKSVDEWLVTRADSKAKAKFLKKLSGRVGTKPNKVQLGEVTEAEFQAA